MTTLLLIDLDNLLPYTGREAGALGEQALRFCLQWISGPPIAPTQKDCVVVSAMNLTSAGSRKLTLSQLDQFASRVAARCVQGAHVVSHEILLVQDMPEASDLALHRSLTMAAARKGAVEVNQLILISKDHGLRQSFHPTPQTQGGAFHFCSLNRPIPRSILEPRDGQGDLGEFSGWRVVDSETMARAAARRSVNAQRELASVTYQMQANPGLLTQLGATALSHRGAARLRILLSEGKVQLACHEQEQLEIQGAPARPVRLDRSTLALSSAGYGSVALSTPETRNLVASRLPWYLLSCTLPHCARALRPETTSIPDDHLLELGGQMNTGLSRPQEVRFQQDTNSLRCVLTGNTKATNAPEVWWVYAKHPGSRRSVTCKLQGSFQAGVLGQRRIDRVIGQFHPTMLDGNAELLCRSPLQVGDVVVLREDAARGTLALALSVDNPPLMCAFLAVGRAWKARASVPCVAIQHASLPDLRRLTGFSDEDLKLLRRLPIVVPLDVLGDSAGGAP